MYSSRSRIVKEKEGRCTDKLACMHLGGVFVAFEGFNINHLCSFVLVLFVEGG